MINPAATNTISRIAYTPFLLGVLGATPNECTVLDIPVHKWSAR
ncbi:hypothetical protein RMP67_08965 [Streptococcus suis]|nr:hypothetical protein [Streptococcus suis]WNO79671.1 hypothetical protein RMP67_08965 [Streptococcus suis]